MHYLVYKTTNTKTFRYYIGAHRTDNLNDSYLGSGVELNGDIEAYGVDAFSREILEECSTAHEMYERERILIGDLWSSDPLCYNLRPGGKGGWNHVDNSGDRNPMRNPSSLAKCVAAGNKTRAANPEKYARVAIENAKLATAAIRGKKRPSHSEAMKQISRDIWSIHRDKMLDSLNQSYLVVKEDGTSFETNRLNQWCKIQGLPFTTLWKSAVSGKVIKKGKLKKR
jgi:hypothetical protein